MIPKRSELVARYGAIDLNGAPAWPKELTHMKMVQVPTLLQGHLLHKDVDGNPRPTWKLWVNKDMAEPILRAMMNIVERQVMSKVHEYGGCFSIRNVRGCNRLSAHAYALAVDINPSENPLGSAPSLDSMHPELVKCFTDEGFVWGGTFERLDPMHFQYLIEDLNPERI